MSETKKRYFSPLGRVVLVFFLVIMFAVFFLAWIRERQKPEKLKVLEIEQEELRRAAPQARFILSKSGQFLRPEDI